MTQETTLEKKAPYGEERDGIAACCPRTGEQTRGYDRTIEQMMADPACARMMDQIMAGAGCAEMMAQMASHEQCSQLLVRMMTAWESQPSSGTGTSKRRKPTG